MRLSRLARALLKKADVVIQDGKEALIAAIAEKGIVVDSTNSFEEMASAINNISTSAQKVKLNITAPYTKDIILSKPTPVGDLCTSTLTYVAGDGQVRYDCDYNNADASNFQNNDNVLFDGKMHVKSNFSYNVTANEAQIYQSDSIDITKYITISDISFGNDSLSLSATIPPQLILPVGDINLTGIDSIDSIAITGNVTGESKMLLIMSFDSGVTWKSIDGVNIVSVDTNNVNDIRTKGMTITTVNNNLTTILNSNLQTKIRFGYFLEQKLITDICENDRIILSVILNGTNSICPVDRYSLTYNETTHTITYTFNTNGTYVINYVD